MLIVIRAIRLKGFGKMTDKIGGKKMKNGKLKSAIFESPFTQTDLAAQAKINPSILSLIVNGKYNPDAALAARIAGLLNRSTEELFDNGRVNR